MRQDGLKKGRTASESRITKETRVDVVLDLDGDNDPKIKTGIAFFDHMLTLFSVHGFFDLSLSASGDLDVDFHHTVEDVGIVLGIAFDRALGERKQIKRYGYAATPMDEALSAAAIDLSKRPYLVYNLPSGCMSAGNSWPSLAKEFFRAFCVAGGMNLHINVFYGENEHHILESVFKSVGRALREACTVNARIKGVRSSKGVL
jgi:imidazoleglycerol-phosphate dehydratase